MSRRRTSFDTRPSCPIAAWSKAGPVGGYPWVKQTVRGLLNELAAEIGTILEQEEVYVGYRDRTWTLKNQ